MKHKIELLMRDTVDVLCLQGVLDWDFSVKEGEFVLALCEGAQDKQALLHAACGLVPVKGEVTLCGTRLNGLRDKARAELRKQHTAFVSPDALCVEDRTVLWNVEEFCGREDARIEELLQDAGLADRVKQKAARLSLAERQRLAVVRAMAKGAALVLTDESAVKDAKAAELLRLCNRRGSAVLLAATDDSWQETADKIVRREA